MEWYFSVGSIGNASRAADKPPRLQERDFSSTAYVPAYVMLPVIDYIIWENLFLMSSVYFLWGQLGVINMDCQLVDQDNLLNQVKILKPVNVDGVRHAPQQFNWSGYKCLFQIMRNLKLKLQLRRNTVLSERHSSIDVHNSLSSLAI
ncbi:Beta-amylase 7 [Camellia lanceoleosa]|uniref:Beta-amylase 7 n=1 Tax=Camellia lanceoleosa TaxID=1840588 RepID=A0ACC0G1D8_9ERIC|nr:Beta-amylase 7 [Camellia lanceoleosa]